MSDLATIIIAVATVGYAFLTLGILRATQENSRISRDMLEIAYRPYVSVSNVTTVRKTAAQYVIVISLRNDGAVPSTEMETFVKIYFDSTEAGLPSRYGLHHSFAPHGGGGDINAGLTDEQSRLLMASEANVQLSLSVRYRSPSKQEYRYECDWKYYRPYRRFIPTDTKLC